MAVASAMNQAPVDKTMCVVIFLLTVRPLEGRYILGNLIG